MDRPAYTRAQLERLIAPKSIAVVGASPRAGSFGMRTLENLEHFPGEILPVNANTVQRLTPKKNRHWMTYFAKRPNGTMASSVTWRCSVISKS